MTVYAGRLQFAALATVVYGISPATYATSGSSARFVVTSNICLPLCVSASQGDHERFSCENLRCRRKSMRGFPWF